MNLKVVFMGTPAFAVPTLEALCAAEDITVLGVLCQPDRPAGRGQKLVPPPVKLTAQAQGLPVFQPEKLSRDEDVLGWLAEQQADAFITVAFGQILSQRVLDMPRLGTVNVHASLLPMFRGANPIQAAIVQGHTETGLTTMLTERGVDTGPILLMERLAIGPDEAADALAERLSALGGPLLLKTLRGLADGSVQPQPQDHEAATHAPKGSKDDAWLDWTRSAQALHNQVRGQQPWPGAATLFRGEPLKILETRVADPGAIGCSGDPGEVLQANAEGLWVQTGDGVLRLVSVQPPGKRPMPAQAWAVGSARGEAIRFELFSPAVVSTP